MPSQAAVPQTLLEAEIDARRLLNRDRDEPTVSIYLPESIAGRLLRLRGWTQTGRGGWRSPATGDTCWERDEALTRALVAEGLSAPLTAEADDRQG